MPSKKTSAPKGTSEKNKKVLAPDEGSHIVFEDEGKKGKKSGKPKETAPSVPIGPPKPTAK